MHLYFVALFLLGVLLLFSFLGYFHFFYFWGVIYGYYFISIYLCWSNIFLVSIWIFCLLVSPLRKIFVIFLLFGWFHCWSFWQLIFFRWDRWLEIFLISGCASFCNGILNDLKVRSWLNKWCFGILSVFFHILGRYKLGGSVMYVALMSFINFGQSFGPSFIIFSIWAL